MASDNRILESSTKSIYYSIAIQLLFRASSFLLNIVLLRLISKDLLGLVNVRLMLLFNTIYCLSTEPCLRTCLSRVKGAKTIPPSTINTLWLCLPIGLLWSVLCIGVWLICFEWPDNSITQYYTSAVFCYGLSAFIEILSEPIRIISQILLLVKVKPFVEGVSLAVESVVLVTCVILWPSMGLLAFCVARLCHSCCVSACYYFYLAHKLRCQKKEKKKNDGDLKLKNEFPFDSFREILPNFFASSSIINSPPTKYTSLQTHKTSPTTTTQNTPPPTTNNTPPPKDTPLTTNTPPPTNTPLTTTTSPHALQSALLWSFSKQVMLKQLITEGEKYIMTIFGLMSFEDQGVYSLVSNLGSMVVRILMLPMEEGFYLFVSRSLPRDLTTKITEKSGEEKFKNELKGSEDVQTETTTSTPASLQTVSDALESITKLRLLMGLILSSFGFSCSFMVLDVLFGSGMCMPPGPMLLRLTSFYLLFVSLNGVLEAFQNATMSKQQVNQHNKYMVIFSFSYLLICLFLTSFLPSILPSFLHFMLPSSSTSFILSNCITMSLRIVYSTHHIHNYFKHSSHHPLQAFHLPTTVTGAFVTVFIVTVISEKIFVTNIEKSSLLLLKLMWYSCHSVVVVLCLVVVILVVCWREARLVTFVKENYLKKKTH